MFIVRNGNRPNSYYQFEPKMRIRRGSLSRLGSAPRVHPNDKHTNTHHQALRFGAARSVCYNRYSMLLVEGGGKTPDQIGVLTVEEVSEILKVNIDTVRRLPRHGDVRLSCMEVNILYLLRKTLLN